MARALCFLLGALVGGAVGFGACAVLTCCAVEEARASMDARNNEVEP